MSLRHPAFAGAPSEKMKGVWVKHKTTGTVGYITMAIKPYEATGLPPIVVVVWPPTPHNKRIASIKTYTGGEYRADMLIRIKRPRKRLEKWYAADRDIS